MGDLRNYLMQLFIFLSVLIQNLILKIICATERAAHLIVLSTPKLQVLLLKVTDHFLLPLCSDSGLQEVSQIRRVCGLQKGNQQNYSVLTQSYQSRDIHHDIRGGTGVSEGGRLRFENATLRPP